MSFADYGRSIARFMPTLEALIFDVDGTLAETERDAHRVAFNLAFAEAGLDWEWSVERYGELVEVAGGKERILAYRQSDRPHFHPSGDLFAWAADLHQAKSQHYRQLLMAGKIPLRPGVRRLIQEARAAGVRLAIASTSAPDNVLALLETALAPDSPTWFEVIAAGDIVPAKKPAPDIYLYVLQKLNLSTDACLVLEDTNQGLTAALGAGLKTVVTRNDYTCDQDFTGAVLVLDHLGEPDLPFCLTTKPLDKRTYFDLSWARSLLATETHPTTAPIGLQ